MGAKKRAGAYSEGIEATPMQRYCSAMGAYS